MAARRYEIYRSTSERSGQVKHFSTRENNLVSPSDHVIFFLLYKMFAIYNDVCGDFPKISDHSPKISEDFPNLVRRPDERFQTFPEHFRTFYEDYRRLPKMIKEDPKMFQSYTKFDTKL